MTTEQQQQQLFIVTGSGKLVDAFHSSILSQEALNAEVDAQCAAAAAPVSSLWSLLTFRAARNTGAAAVVKPLLPPTSQFQIVQLASLDQLSASSASSCQLEGALCIVDCAGGQERFAAATQLVRRYARQVQAAVPSSPPPTGLFMVLLVDSKTNAKEVRRMFRDGQLPMWLDVVLASHHPIKVVRSMLLKQSLAASGFLF